MGISKDAAVEEIDVSLEDDEDEESKLYDFLSFFNHLNLCGIFYDLKYDFIYHSFF